jgi:AcrR family transcriptional regulator
MRVKSTGRKRGRPSLQDGHREATRKRLLDAAAVLFIERGFEGARVDAILAEANLSKGAFYWHFESKEDLFSELLRERIEQPLDEMIELLNSASPDDDMSVVASQKLLALLEREPETILLEYEYRLAATRDQKLGRRYAQHQARFRAALGKALGARARQLRAPPFDTPDEQIATVYLVLANALAIEKLIDDEAVPDHLFGETAALIYRGLVARAEDKRD